MQVARKKPRFNYQDYLHLPEDKRYEILDGDLCMVPAPATVHQKILWNLAKKLSQFIEVENSGDFLIAPVDVILSDEDILQPDILFVSKERLKIITEKNIQGAPDLVVEILSSSNREKDLTIKRKIYETYGVREYWIVDPEAQSVEVLKLTDDGFKLTRVFTRGTHIQSSLLEGIQILVEDIFP